MKRSGLHRLECPQSCDCGPLYSTVANIETRQLPLCGGCGSRLVPESLELAALVLSRDELEQLPAFVEFSRQLASIHRGQAGPGKRAMQTGRHLRPADELAMARVERERRESARTRQLSGLRQYRTAAATADEIPF